MIKKCMLILLFLIIPVLGFAQDSIRVGDNNEFNQNPDEVRKILMNPIIEDAKNTSGDRLNNSNSKIEKSTSGDIDNVSEGAGGKQTVYYNKDTARTPNEITMSPIGENEVRVKNENRPVIKVSVNHEKPLLRNVQQNARYILNGKNFISENGINAIVAPVKITGFVPEPGVVSHIWIKNGYGVAFQLKKRQSHFQAVVTFESQKAPLSLFFDVRNVPGRVIEIPSTLAGTSKLSIVENGESLSMRDDEVIVDLMNKIINNKKLDNAWNYDAKCTFESPYNEFLIRKYQHWYNDTYSIKSFVLCSKTKSKLFLTERTFARDDTLGITITKHALRCGECTRLVVISAQPYKDAEEIAKFSPRGEK